VVSPAQPRRRHGEVKGGVNVQEMGRLSLGPVTEGAVAPSVPVRSEFFSLWRRCPSRTIPAAKDARTRSRIPFPFSWDQPFFILPITRLGIGTALMNRFGSFLIPSFGLSSWEHYVIHGQEPDRLVSTCTSIG
jgi:hypothetical protein